MNKITLEQLLDEQLLQIPEIDEVLLTEDVRRGHRFKNTGGVYIFYNRFNEPLYVGISYNVGKRVPEHLFNSKGNPDLQQYLNCEELQQGCYVAVFYEKDKAKQELYESYLIKLLFPRFNINKTDRDKL